MIRATISSINEIQCRKRCDILRSLKKEGVGTSEVEGPTKKLRVNRENKNLKNTLVDRVKKIVMKEKLNDTYAEYRHSVYEDSETWKQLKKAITGTARVGYLRQLRSFVGRYNKKVKEDGQKKVECLVSK